MDSITYENIQKTDRLNKLYLNVLLILFPYITTIPVSNNTIEDGRKSSDGVRYLCKARPIVMDIGDVYSANGSKAISVHRCSGGFDTREEDKRNHMCVPIKVEPITVGDVYNDVSLKHLDSQHTKHHSKSSTVSS